MNYMPTADIGHNSGGLAEQARLELAELLSPRITRIDQLCDAAGRAAAVDQDSAGKCADLVRMIRKEAEHVDGLRAQVKGPYLAATRSIDGEAKQHTDRLAAAKSAVERKLDQFNREERAKAEAERRRQEELRRIAEEEARAAAGSEEPALAAIEPAPAPAPATPPRIEGDLGAKVIGKTVWKHEITDWAQAFAAVSENAKVREAIEKAIAARVKAGERAIPGVRIYEDIKTEVR